MTDAGPSGREVGVVFERMLDQALNSQQVRDALDRAAGVFSREQLRTRAQEARTAITAAVAVEYQAYVRARSAVTGPHGPADGARRAAPARGAGPLLLLPAAARAVLRLRVTRRGARSAGGGRTPADAEADAAADVARAREVWELALLERGVVPFLLGRLEEVLMRERGDRAGRRSG
ncbi:hypothetical protein AB0E10_25910 [Streptomyces sp. NPDC048045]|uniref:hypothetical protein n=1 Tax=Streptomyces sp. NPDC048045 TaxID=3154710 RepID=UPI003418040E